MKKFTVLIMMIAMVFAMTACGSKEAPEVPAEPEVTEEVVVEDGSVAGSVYELESAVADGSEIDFAGLTETLTFNMDGTYEIKSVSDEGETILKGTFVQNGDAVDLTDSETGDTRTWTVKDDTLVNEADQVISGDGFETTIHTVTTYKLSK